MKPPPKNISGARVICYAPIDERHIPTGNCRQYIGGNLQGPARALAICQYANEDGYYLFGCDADWNAVTDTFHVSLEEAKDQAEFEYQGVSVTWQNCQ